MIVLTVYYIYHSNLPLIILITMKLTIILMVFITIATCSKMVVDFDSSTIATSVFWVRAKVVIKGGMPPYVYQYSQLPYGWKQVHEFIYIPTADLSAQKKYPCRLLVQDRFGDQLTASITFIIESGQVFLDGVTYVYGQQFESATPTHLKEAQSHSELRIAQGTIQVPQQSEHEQEPQSPQPQITKTKQSIGNIFESTPSQQQQDDQFSFSYNQQNGNFFSNGIETTAPKTVILTVPEQPQPTVKHPSMIPSSVPITEDLSDETTRRKINEVISKANKQTQSPNRSIDEIFRKLPTFEELDEIIISVDTLAISKTIQTVLVSEMDCDQKISYLSEFFGRIQNNVQLKRLSLKKLELIKNLAKEQIQRLIDEISRLNSEKKNLKLFELHKRLEIEILKLEKAYDTYNEAVAEKQVAEKKLPTYEKTMKDIRDNLNRQKEQLPLQEDQLSKLEQQIYQAELILEKLKTKRSQKMKQIEKRKSKIKQLESQLETTIKKAKQTSMIIVNAPRKLDQLKRKYLLLEVQVARVRQDISSSSKKQEKILRNIEKINDKIQKEQDKIREREIQAIEQVMGKLQRNLPKIQEQIDRLYYSCYEASQIVQKSTDPSKLPSYLIEPRKFVNYLEMVYGLDTTKNLQKVKENAQISITKSSLFSETWSSRYGSAFRTVDESGGQQLIKNDFNCLRPSKLVTKSGVIKYIRENMIIVKGDDGNIYKLFLGSCSRMESVGSEVPTVEQRIIFKGNQDIEQEFKVYSASSY